VHTPLFWGAPLSAGVLVFFLIRLRPFLINWLIVGIISSIFRIDPAKKVTI
jgi:hypothetical protein